MKGKSFAIVFCLLAAGVCGFSQTKADKEFEKARVLLSRHEEDKAEELLLKIAGKYPDYPNAPLALGEMYFARKDYGRAKAYLISVVEKDGKFDLNAHRKLADIYSFEQKPDSALLYLENYLHLAPETSANKLRREQAERLADCMRFRINALSNPVSFSPENLGSGVNTPFDEYLPTMTLDQAEMLFTRRTATQAGKVPEEDFFLAGGRGGQWTKSMKLAGSLNTEYNDGAGCISPDGRYIYFTRCYAPDSKGGCDIYRSRREGELWGEPENLGANVNSSAWDAQPTIASDNRTLFFVSNREGGFGGSDIYYSYLRDDGTWSKAKNCGEVINTPGKEMSPFIHPSNQTLYFSSDYHCGMGGQDIFYSRLENGRFSPPTNMGSPINTSSDESSLVVSPRGDYAIYASDREGGCGGLDLYRFELYKEARPLAATYLCGKIFDSRTKTPIRAEFEIRNIETGRIVSSGESDAVVGEYLVCLPVGSVYSISARAEGYLFYSDNISLVDNDASKPYEKQIELEKVEVGRSIVLNNIFFATNSSEVLASSNGELTVLVRLLKENPTLKVEIEGHTDNMGTADYNLKLSNQRAEAVKNRLVEMGIAPERLSSRGYGASKPVADNDSELSRAKNRRTEIRIREK